MPCPTAPFRPRAGRFNWQALHGVDVDQLCAQSPSAAAAAAVERLVDELAGGDVLQEPGPLSPSNYRHLIRLLQLAVQYVQHVRQALQAGAQQLRQCSALGCRLAALQQQLCARAEEQVRLAASPASNQGLLALPRWDWASDAVHQQASRLSWEYRNAAQALQAGPGRPWCPRPPSQPFDWLAVHSLDVDRELCAGLPNTSNSSSRTGVQRLQQLLPMLVAGRLDSGSGGSGSGAHEGQGMVPGAHSLEPPNYIQLVRLLQCGLDLELSAAEAAHADKSTARQEWVSVDSQASSLSSRWHQLQKQLAAAWEYQHMQGPAGQCPSQHKGSCCYNSNRLHGGASAAPPVVLSSTKSGGCPAVAAVPPLYAPGTCVSPLWPAGSPCQGCSLSGQPAGPAVICMQSWPCPGQCCCGGLTQAAAPPAASWGGSRPPATGVSPPAQPPHSAQPAVQPPAMQHRGHLHLPRQLGSEGGAAVQQQRQLALVEESLSEERRRSQDMRQSLATLWSSVDQLCQSQQLRNPPAPPAPSSAAAEPTLAPPEQQWSATDLEVDTTGVNTAVWQQAEAAVRFQVEDIKRRAFQDMQGMRELWLRD